VIDWRSSDNWEGSCGLILLAEFAGMKITKTTSLDAVCAFLESRFDAACRVGDALPSKGILGFYIGRLEAVLDPLDKAELDEGGLYDYVGSLASLWQEKDSAPENDISGVEYPFLFDPKTEDQAILFATIKKRHDLSDSSTHSRASKDFNVLISALGQGIIKRQQLPGYRSGLAQWRRLNGKTP